MVTISSGPGRFIITSVTIEDDHDLINVTFVQVSHVTTCYILHKCMHTLRLLITPMLVHDFKCMQWSLIYPMSIYLET